MPHTCPVCRASGAEPIFALDDVPAHVAVVFRTPSQARAVARGDIRLALCTHCGHVWNDAYDPALTDYSGEYDASLHHSPVYARFLAETTAALSERWPLAGRTVVEVGCGEGTFLRLLTETTGASGVGIDPSAPEEAEPGIAYWRESFGEEQARALEARDVALTVSRHMLHYATDHVAFVRWMAAVGAPLYVEVPNGAWVFEEAAPWTVFYEHVHYYSPSSLARTLAEAGVESEVAPVYRDGQYLAATSSAGTSGKAATPPPETHIAAVRAFGRSAHDVVGYWRARLFAMADAGDRVVVWGAAGRGTTFVGAMPDDTVLAVVDNNPARQGSFLASTGHPVVSPAALVALKPDRVILTNPTYAPEILRQLHDIDLDPKIDLV